MNSGNRLFWYAPHQSPEVFQPISMTEGKIYRVTTEIAYIETSVSTTELFKAFDFAVGSRIGVPF